MRLLIIDNYDSFTYNLVQLVEQSGCHDFDVVFNDSIPTDYAEKYDRLLISPGPGMPHEVPGMLDWIKEASLSKRILGVCLGHQAIVEAFGGSLIRLEKILHGEATNIFVSDKNEKLFTGLPDFFPGGRYHSWVADPEQLPASLKITAMDADGNIMALTHRHYDVKGIQFHPESIMTPEGAKIIANWLKA